MAKKSAAAKKAAVAKKAPVGKKSAAKKSPVAKKSAAAKKPAAKRAAAKRAAAKKSGAAKKSAAAKKKPAATSTGKSPTKKAPAKKKPAARKRPTAITKRVSRKRPARRSATTKPVIGWREWVRLPELTPTPIKAKVDSGAVTSALHAFNLRLTTSGDTTVARFAVAPKQRSNVGRTTVEYPVAGFKKVRSSNGQTELRPVIRTEVVIGDKSFEIDITLTSRDAMGFRMLLGRRAVRNRFVIDPGRSFLQPAVSDDGSQADQ